MTSDFTTALTLTPFEAEHYVESIDYLDLEDVGSAKWLTQHEYMEKLNHLAHHQAKSGTDEYVVDYLQTHDKIKVLIHDLVVIELWKEEMYPLLKSHIAPMSSLRNYIPLYHEATCVNLLEVALFQSTSCEVAGDAIVDLIDYVYRKLVYLVRTANEDLWTKPLGSAKEAAAWTNEQLVDSQYLETEFQVAMCTISILRFLTDHRSLLPLTITSRLVETHDVLLLLVPLMEKSPWVRKRNGVIEKFEDQAWEKVADEDIGQLPKLHSQLWLTIYNLVMDNECRSRYSLTSFRKDNLLRLRRYLNEIVFDQIPPLTELLRTLEEISITGNFTGDMPQATPFVVEVVAEIRENLLARYKGQWEETAEKLKTEVFTKETKKELGRLESMIIIPEMEEDYNCIKCGNPAENRCSRCKKEWYCSRECQVTHWPEHKELCAIHIKAELIEQEKGNFCATDEREEKHNDRDRCESNDEPKIVEIENTFRDDAVPLVTEVH